MSGLDQVLLNFRKAFWQATSCRLLRQQCSHQIQVRSLHQPLQVQSVLLELHQLLVRMQESELCRLPFLLELRDKPVQTTEPFVRQLLQLHTVRTLSEMLGQLLDLYQCPHAPKKKLICNRLQVCQEF